jgi:integrase
MGRPATGQVVVRKTQRGRVLALRFSAYGKRQYVTLGTAEEGWTRQKAEDELANILADVRRGIWRPSRTERVEPPTDPTFHEFASDWLKSREHELRPRTVADYRWVLTYHLLPFFAAMRVGEITVADVDRYKAAKLAEGRIAAAQINRTLRILALILDLAIEYGVSDKANPARGRRRRVKAARPRRTWVEPEQLMALLDEARTFRPILATLAGAGLRVGEAIALDWGDVNLATGVLTVQASKTPAGTGREIDLPGGLLDELKTHKAASQNTEPSEPVFTTRPINGESRRQSDANVRRALKQTLARANVVLERAAIEPVSERVSPHSLRRTYASLRGALRDDPVYIAEQLGHEDPTFTFRVYQRSVKRRQRLSGAYLEAFDQALEWALMGTGEALDADPRDRAETGSAAQTAQQSQMRTSRDLHSR